MKYYGLKKTTLIDYPGHIACTAFTHGCSLRCPFCHNPKLVVEKENDDDSITSEDLLSFLEKRVGKLEGIVFTGGEPLLHADTLLKLLKKVKALDYLVKIDTNGTFPQELKDFIEEGVVDYIAMDFKTDPNEYETMGATRKHIRSILKSLQLLKDSPISYEIRTTLVPGIHTHDTFKKMMPHLEGIGLYALQSFAPNGTIDPAYEKVKPFSPNELDEFFQIAQKTLDNVVLRN